MTDTRRSPRARGCPAGALFLLVLVLSAGAAPAQDTAACARPAPRPLTLTHPFLPLGDTVTLLTGELVANAAEGRGSLTIEYLTRAAPDSARLAREAASLARAVTPYIGSTPFAVITVRACRRPPGAGARGELAEGGSRAGAVAATFTFTQAAGGEWQLAPP